MELTGRNLPNLEKNKRRAGEFRRLLVELGPTYIKLGQFLSVRRDILPPVFADELASLCDQVPPFSLEQVRKTIAVDLGRRPEMLFDSFDPTPIASASIGQVHKAVLRDGGDVVVKVQRPDLAHEFYQDLGFMRLAARAGIFLNDLKLRLPQQYTQGTKSQSEAQAQVDGWLALSNEFGRSLFAETDYLIEGRNADRLRRILRRQPEVRVPRVIWRYTGRRVLTLEYIAGTRIDNVERLKQRGVDLKELGNRLVGCYLEQLVSTGFFHADPHAGNLAVDNQGNLVIYDFGMMGQITQEQRQDLLGCMQAVITNKPEKVTQYLTRLGIVATTADPIMVTRAITPFMDYYSGREIMDLDFTHLERDIDSLIASGSFRLPATLAYLLRAGTALEGIARTLKHDFSFVNAARPHVVRFALEHGFETLARSGNFKELSDLVFKEIAQMRTPQTGPTPSQTMPAAQSASNSTLASAASESRPSLPVDASAAANKSQTQQSVSDMQVATSGANPAEPLSPGRLLPPFLPSRNLGSSTNRSQDKEPVAIAKSNIDVQKKAFKRLQALLVAYLLVSTSLPVFVAWQAGAHYRQLSLYFLIGNLVLGAIIFWKLIAFFHGCQGDSQAKKADDGD